MPKQFLVADDDLRVTQHLLALIQQIPTGGRQVHDANIVATMLVYQVSTVLTHNVEDFDRFAGVVTVLPLA
jgi:predicted nucleic acid-binding protein